MNTKAITFFINLGENTRIIHINTKLVFSTNQKLSMLSNLGILLTLIIGLSFCKQVDQKIQASPRGVVGAESKRHPTA